LTNTLGFLDNALGARQMLRKIGRAHARVAFLQAHVSHAKSDVTKHNEHTNSNDDIEDINQLDYFGLFALLLRDHLMPSFVEDVSKRKDRDKEADNRKVRFQTSYKPAEVSGHERGGWKMIWQKTSAVCPVAGGPCMESVHQRVRQ
jgi:hypothetical protein